MPKISDSSQRHCFYSFFSKFHSIRLIVWQFTQIAYIFVATMKMGHHLPSFSSSLIKARAPSLAAITKRRGRRKNCSEHTSTLSNNENPDLDLAALEIHKRKIIIARQNYNDSVEPTFWKSRQNTRRVENHINVAPNQWDDHLGLTLSWTRG